MANYRYKAMDKQGKKIEGMFTANTEGEVLQMIKSNDYYPLSIEEALQRETESITQSFSKVKLKDIAIFCRQFYTMLNAGVNILGCLDVLRNQTENLKLRKVINEIFEDVQKAVSFSEALNKHKDIFPELFINMVEAGEVSGNLDVIMSRMADHYEKENKTNSKIKSAMVYPIILSIVAIGVVIFLLTFVMPMFIDMFESSGVKIPAPTRILLNISNGIRNFWYLILIVIIGGVYGLKMYGKTERGRLGFDELKLKIPLFKSTNKKIIIARFTRTLSTLLASGITVISALQIVAKVSGNKVAEIKILEVRDQAIKGGGLYTPLSTSNFFPPMLCSMVKVGEESGSLDEILEKTANFYDDELEEGLKKMTTLIEPIMIVIMGIVVGFIVIAMMMPMFDMFKAVGA